MPPSVMSESGWSEVFEKQLVLCSCFVCRLQNTLNLPRRNAGLWLLSHSERGVRNIVARCRISDLLCEFTWTCVGQVDSYGGGEGWEETE